MKILLVVFPLHYSHGSLLQTFALYSKLKELGNEVTILNREPDKRSCPRYALSVLKRIVKRMFFGSKGAIFYKGAFPQRIMENLNEFIGLMEEDLVTVCSTRELHDYVCSHELDAFVVGSDQTWRPRFVANVMDYWLDFARERNAVKVAYAPSFGTDVWEYSDEEATRCKALAKLFTAVSVREKGGVKLCREYLGVEPVHVLDPTLLYDSSFYMKLVKQVPSTSHTCQCYFLDRTDEKLAIANQLAVRRHLTLNYVNTRTEDVDAPLEERIAPSISQWLSGFASGELIVVDSFHAMVFSIIFEKDFVAIGNAGRGMARFESLLGELGLSDRLVLTPKDAMQAVEKPIDWNEVERRLENWRLSSIDFLKNALQ